MIGRTISRYSIESSLGEGGMGAVYLARDTSLGRKVAIKVISPAASSDPDLASRLLREAQAASRLNHPNIVTVYEVGQADGVDFIAMEHVEGRPLSDAIPPGGLPIPKVLDYVKQIVGAMATAHAAGIVHRDLKPANVMVTTTERLKVLDFGLARRVEPGVVDEAARTQSIGLPSLTLPGTVLGTVGYMAPEQIEGKPAGARSDVFALGVIMYEMLAGRRPFASGSAWAEMAGAVAGTAPPIESLRPDTPRDLARIVARCLARKPEDRYASAAELEQDLAAVVGARGGGARMPRVVIAAVGALAVAAIGVIGLLLARESRVRWARDKAPAEIASLVAQDKIAVAYLLARKAIAIAPGDALVKQAWINLAPQRTIVSDPSGADLAFHGYRENGDVWVVLGKTPMQTRVPPGLLHWRVTKPGFDTLEVQAGFDQLEFQLLPAGTSRPGMVHVPSGEFELESTGENMEVPDYWIDRTEVTNREFKRFVDAGGYGKPEYWKEPVFKGGRALSWQAAMAEFRDETGRPGPSTWELGSYREGQADYPVSGVSWYEAAAYAAFAGKRMPTAYHWFRAAGVSGVFSEIINASNFSGKGLAKVASLGSLGPFGTYDMAGNVKEWCWNEAGAGRRYILGGAWNEPSYTYHDEDARSPFDRQAAFGFRCMQEAQPTPPRFLAAITTFERNPSKLTPVSDDVFRAHAHLYDYDATPLDTKVEAVDDANPAWRKEKISVRAAYGNERLPIYVFVPKSSKPPYQAVVYFPGSNAVMLSSSQDLYLGLADYHIRAGRMLVYPVYQSTYERRIPRTGGMNQLRDIMIERGKDVRRTIDYLQSRPDADASRIAFYGVSLGAQLGPIYLAIEPRFRTGVLFSGGFETWQMPPESDPINFAPRVKTSVLMVNGREDFDLPYATAQVPMFRALGTPEADKRHVVLEGGHIPAHPQEAIKAMLDWLDQRMGPVR